MMSGRVKLQLIVFAVITLFGTSYVGAVYANLVPNFLRGEYSVEVSLPVTGGVYEGADVTYRGVSIGKISKLVLTADGVDATVRIEESKWKIPADTQVVVAQRSAIGEQYMDFRPRSDGGPYLQDGSKIAQANTQIPVSTEELLTSTVETLQTVNPESINVVIDELGKAFDGRGQDLTTLFDSTTSLLKAADENFEPTADLVRQAETILQTQLDGESDIRAWSRNLSLLASTLRSSDGDLRTVIDQGTPTAQVLRRVIEANKANLAALFRDAQTFNKVMYARLPGIKGVLLIAPYGVRAASSIVAKAPGDSAYSVRFTITAQNDPKQCLNGYPSGIRTEPTTTADRTNFPSGYCKSSSLMPRGAAGAGSALQASAPAGSVMGVYQAGSDTVKLADGAVASDVTTSNLVTGGTGEESWRWLMLSAATTR